MLLTPEDDWGFIPDVTTGPSGNTYVFFPGRPVNDAAGQPGIYFSRWEDDHWSSPKDVLVAPDGNVLHTLAAVEDGNGYLNLVMTGSTAWYSRAPMHEADNPRAWSVPVGIFSQDRAMTIDAVLGSDGATHVAIGSDRGVVYHVAISADGMPGYPTIVRSIVDDEYYPDVVSVVSTLQGSLHMCWVEVRSGSRGFYCSTSHDQGSTWTAVEQVAAGHRGGSIFYLEQQGLLARITYGGVGVGGRELQLSEDDGVTWSKPVDLTQGVYMQGLTGQFIGMDSSGALQVLVNPGNGQYVYSQYKDGVWTPNLNTGWQARDFISATIANGNVLAVGYWLPGSMQATQLKLKAQRIESPTPFIPAATSTSDPGEGGTPTSGPESQPTTVTQPEPIATGKTEVSARALSETSANSQRDAISPVFVGPISALVLIGAAVWWQRRKRP